jgi:4'-phosphopantetheinyl transferase
LPPSSRRTLAESRSGAFVGDFLTEGEVVAVRRLAAGRARDVAANLIWSAKEAAMKVLKVGLRADTRDVEVEREGLRRPDGWMALSMTHRDGSAFSGWWRRDGEFALTIAGRQPAAPPSWLSGGAALADAVPVHSWLAQPLVPAPDANSGQACPQDGPR